LKEPKNTGRNEPNARNATADNPEFVDQVLAYLGPDALWALHKLLNVRRHFDGVAQVAEDCVMNGDKS